jgi:hypothetical protein
VQRAYGVEACQLQSYRKGNQILAVLPLEFVGQKVEGMASDGEGKRGFFFCEGKGKEVHEREL